MSTVLLDLSNRVITTKGTTVAKYQWLLEKALNGESFSSLPFVQHEDAVRYFRLTGGGRMWVDDGKVVPPSKDTYRWVLPEDILEMDIEAYLLKRLNDYLDARQDVSDEEKARYRIRLNIELMNFRERGWLDFLRGALYVKRVMDENRIVHGPGRGSACSLLVMFLLGLTDVDPVKYDIDMREFFGTLVEED